MEDVEGHSGRPAEEKAGGLRAPRQTAARGAAAGVKKRGIPYPTFIGHGEFDDHGGALVFEDDWQRGKAVSADKLGTVLHDQLSLRLVVLNACEGARASRTDPFSGTAQTLVRQGIPAVLAMQFEITDEAAIAVTSEFYSSVAVGDPIDAALADARLKLYALQDDGVEWATPVLHMRAPDGRIFDVVQTGPVIEKQKERISILAARSRRRVMVAIFATIGLFGAVVLLLWALDMFHWANRAGDERSASQPASIPDATTAAPIFDKAVDGTGPVFAPPTLSGRRIDLCIISPQFPEETGAQCSRPAQIQIANAFCQAAGFRSATNDIYGRNTGQNNKSYKYSQGPGGGQWLKQAGGGAMFESIVCD
jgi:CHAT domain